MAAWEAAAAIDPAHVDALFNAAQAHYNRKEPAAALALWQRARLAAPDDLEVRKKIVQAQHALGRHEEAQQTTAELVSAWRNSDDPRVKQQREFAVDQLDVAGVHVIAYATFDPPPTGFATLFTFRVLDGRGKIAPIVVKLETSEVAREAGTPFVLSLDSHGKYQVVGALKSLPPHAELMDIASKLVAQAVSQPS